MVKYTYHDELVGNGNAYMLLNAWVEPALRAVYEDNADDGRDQGCNVRMTDDLEYINVCLQKQSSFFPNLLLTEHNISMKCTNPIHVNEVMRLNERRRNL